MEFRLLIQQHPVPEGPQIESKRRTCKRLCDTFKRLAKLVMPDYRRPTMSSFR